jgi:hypothetical protein
MVHSLEQDLLTESKNPPAAALLHNDLLHYQLCGVQTGVDTRLRSAECCIVTDDHVHSAVLTSALHTLCTIVLVFRTNLLADNGCSSSQCQYTSLCMASHPTRQQSMQVLVTECIIVDDKLLHFSDQNVYAVVDQLSETAVSLNFTVFSILQKFLIGW